MTIEQDPNFQYATFYRLGIADTVADLVTMTEYAAKTNGDLNDFMAGMKDDIAVACKEAREYYEALYKPNAHHPQT